MARSIICTNENNVSLTLTDAFSPWLLESCEGIYEVRNNVSTSENTMTSGSTYQGSTTSMRNIVLTLRDRPETDHLAARSMLYTLFKPGSPGVFTYIEDEISRTIKYYVESVYVDAVKRSRRAQISLLCPDPFFEDLTDISVQMSAWVPRWEFRHEFLAAGEEMGYRSAERLKTIDNTSAADGIGITITVDCTGPVVSPSISLVETGESISVGTPTNPLELRAGDRVIITTHTTNKHVYLVRDGVKTEINSYLTEDSVFLKLMSRENTFGYSAASGEGYMTVTISFRYRYLGV